MEQILSIFNSDRRRARKRFEQKYKEMKLRQSGELRQDIHPQNFDPNSVSRRSRRRSEAMSRDIERQEASASADAARKMFRNETPNFADSAGARAMPLETPAPTRPPAERSEAATPMRPPAERLEAATPTRPPSERLEAAIPTRPPSERLEAATPTHPPTKRLDATIPARPPTKKLDAAIPARPPFENLAAVTPIVVDTEAGSLHDRLYDWVVTKLSRRTQQLIALVMFAAICYSFTGAVGAVYSQANDRNHVNLWSQQRFEDFYALPEGWLDMVFLGSSHSFTTFDPAQFEGRWNAFQLGMPLQTPDSSFFTLLEVYNYQRPGIVVMDLYWNVMKRDFEPAQVETFFMVLRSEELRQRYIDEVLPLNERVKYDIEAIRFQEAAFAFANAWIRNFTRNSERFQDGYTPEIQPYTAYYRALGYVYTNRIMPPAEYERLRRTQPRRLNFQIAPRQRHFLEEMVRLADEHGSQLIFVTAPISNVSFANILDYDDIHREISGFAELHGIPYLDFHKRNIELGLFDDDMFQDHGHLNHRGALVAGAYFMEWLEEVIRQ